MKVTIDQALSYLLRSHPVAIPTETVWGLAARLSDETAIHNIFTLKKRPQSNPLIIHLHSPLDLATYTMGPLPPGTETLMAAFWPGPLTLVLPCNTTLVPEVARAGLTTAGFRVPQDPTSLSLIEKSGPLVAPSANLSGRPSATESKHVEEDFGVDFPCLLADERCHFGIESTILLNKEERWHVGRLGALSLEEITPLLGYRPMLLSKQEKPLCPGQMFRHYAPRARLTLSRSAWKSFWSNQFDALLGFEDRYYDNAPPFISLGSSSNPLSCQHSLYRALRLLDEQQKTSVWVDCALSITSEWEAFFDRLTKASEGK